MSGSGGARGRLWPRKGDRARKRPASGSRLGIKIALLGAGAALAAIVAMTTIAVRSSGTYEALAAGEIDWLVADELDQIAGAAYNLVRAEDESVRQELESALRLARRMLETSGAAADIARGSFPLGKLERDVEAITELGWSEATVFRRTSDSGDMIRVATTVRDASGTMAVGTSIAARGPDGSPNPVISAVLGGRGYRGRAFVVDAWYISAYEPLRSASGKVVGMLFVGIPQAKAESRIREAIIATRVGKTGYVYVVSGQGENRGRYVVSQGGTRDGENIWDLRDSDGTYTTRRIVETALELAPGERRTIRYRWQNPGEPEPRWRTVRIAYYAPWDWLIGVSVYEEEILSFRGTLAEGRERMAGAMYLAGLVVALLVGAASWAIANGIAGPLKRMAAAADLVARGGGAGEIGARSRDEIGTLAAAFESMSRRVEETMAGLRASEEQYRGVFENAAEGIMLTTLEGRCLAANPAMARMLGYESAEEYVEAQRDLRSTLYAAGSDRDAIVAGLLEEGSALGQEIRAKRRDGSTMWVSINARLEPAAPGLPPRILGLVSDIDSRKRADEARKRALDEKDLLLKEIHHRVKNNLQVIASLLSMQSRTISDPKSLALYEDFSGRVLAMSQVHEMLYESEDFSRVDFGEYVRDLAANLRQSYQGCFEGVAVEIEAGPRMVELELNQAVTCALLVNEILSNSFHHAFPPGSRRQGRVGIRVAPGEDGRVEIDIEDDGVGIPPGFELGDPNHLGLALIPLLAAQLEAELSLSREGGTRYRISFKRA
jgi:PAS domain S-box-containing protein